MHDNDSRFSMSLEDQFEHPMHIEVPVLDNMGPDGLPDTVGIQPEIMKIYDLVPLEKTSDVPVVFIPGWNANAEGLREHMLTMARLGRRALGVSAIHGITPKATITGYPRMAVRKMTALLEALEIKDLHQVDAISHSEGTIILALAATAHPKRFRNLIPVAPAGLIGQDNMIRLIVSFGRDIYRQLAIGANDKAHLAKVKAVLAEIGDSIKGRDNFAQSWQAVEAMVSIQIQKLLFDLKQSGHRIAIIHDVDDLEFPMDRMQRIVTKDMVNGFLSIKGQHHEFYRQPEVLTTIMHHILTTFERQGTE